MEQQINKNKINILEKLNILIKKLTKIKEKVENLEINDNSLELYEDSSKEVKENETNKATGKVREELDGKQKKELGKANVRFSQI